MVVTRADQGDGGEGRAIPEIPGGRKIPEKHGGTRNVSAGSPSWLNGCRHRRAIRAPPPPPTHTNNEQEVQKKTRLMTQHKLSHHNPLKERSNVADSSYAPPVVFPSAGVPPGVHHQQPLRRTIARSDRLGKQT